MPTLVSFHAHPDDEAILTGGLIARAAEAGVRVVLVFATRGELGLVPDDLQPGETIGQRREREAGRAAELLGAQRVEFLGYTDSGMLGDAANDAFGCFWQAPVADAASRLAAILEEEDADVLTSYEPTGLYGHPDHLKVHQVASVAARTVGTAGVYEATLNRDRVCAALLRAHRSGIELPAGLDPRTVDGFGLPQQLLTTSVDVSTHLETKRAAMAAHRSQLRESGFFLSLAPEDFEHAFGTEWFIERRGDGLLQELLGRHLTAVA